MCSGRHPVQHARVNAITRICLLSLRAIAQIIATRTWNRDADRFLAWKSSKQLVVATALCAAQLKFVDDQLMVLLRVKRATDCL
jgi:hypothetical protein